jgi:hypothetical protein
MKPSAILMAAIAVTCGSAFAAKPRVNFNDQFGVYDLQPDSDLNPNDDDGSNGAPPPYVPPTELNGGYTFHTGKFGAITPGFVPTAGNILSWKDEWIELESATYDPVSNWFSGSFLYDPDNNANHANFATGDQVWLFGYNSVQFGQSGAQAFLTTKTSVVGSVEDPWVIPPSTVQNVQAPYDWLLTPTGTYNTVFGMKPTDPTGNVYYDLKMGKVPVVPEPGAISLLALASAAVMRRRRR